MNYKKTPKKIEDMQRENASEMVRWLTKQIKILKARGSNHKQELFFYYKLREKYARFLEKDERMKW